MASEKYDAVPTTETSSHPQCSNWLRPWLQNQNAPRSEKALDRGQTLRSNQPITVKTPVCLWQRLFKTKMQKQENET